MGSGLPRKVKNGSSRVSPRGSVFLSYRHSDGAELAIASAWALRCAGVPVWHNRCHLPTGARSVGWKRQSSPVYWAPYCSCPLTPDYGRLALALGELYQMSEGE